MKPRYVPQHNQLVHDKRKESCPNYGKLVTHESVKQHLKSCNDGTKRFPRPIYNCKFSLRTRTMLRYTYTIFIRPKYIARAKIATLT